MTADVDLLSILRDIGARRRNAVGDYWSLDFCNKAAAEIETLRAEVERLTERAQHAEDVAASEHAHAKRLAKAAEKVLVAASARNVLAMFQAAEALGAAQHLASSTPVGAADDFASHRDAWREALNLAVRNAKDADDARYWMHEVRAFDKAYAAHSQPGGSDNDR